MPDKKIYTREFLGVTLVRMGSKPRKATAVISDGHAAALLPNGKVAIAFEDVFEPSFERRSYSQETVAHLLADLGVIPKGYADKFCADSRANKKRKDAQWAYGNLIDAVKTLGIKLTKEQTAKIDAATKH